MTTSILSLAEIAGLVRLAADGTVAISHQAQDLQQRITGAIAIPFALGDGITRLVYGSVRGVAKLSNNAAQLLQKARPEKTLAAPGSKRENAISILNGVCGDHLQATGNALAIAMQLRGAPIQSAKKYALFVHGLCLSDGHWTDSEGHAAHVETLRLLGYEALFLRYNSGAPIAQNARDLVSILAELPVVPAALIIVAHSMGGLVTRLALANMHAEKLPILQALRAVIYLGSPHAGAPLEQVGHWIAQRWARIPFAGALAPLANLRSQGILDLRQGVIETKPARGVRRNYLEFVLAASLRAANPAKVDTQNLLERTLGDGLVPVASALGTQAMASKRIPVQRQCVLHSIGHLDLLTAPQVSAQLRDWIAPL
jgi:pimeloyl-ACP methyl ester carboxylesterase